MALLTALLSAMSRKLGDLLQAVMGWSVAAMFGRLTSRKRVLISVAMILSLLWPLFIIGVFFPAAATFVIAFVPIKDLVSANVLRAIWITLAIVSPISVGLLTRFAAPGAKSKSVLRLILHGPSLTLGYAISFLVTLVTVPMIKIGSAFRRWADEHLYVQPKLGSYDKAVHDLCEACLWAGLQPEVAALPRSMAISTRVLEFFARGAVESLLAEEPKVIRAKGLELYLYPGDLLLRGEKHTLARVRALMGRTMLERDAYLVETDRAQHLQDELGRIYEAFGRHDSPEDAGDILKTRLREIAADTTKPDINYEDWVMLDRIARRVEGKLLGHESLIEQGTLEEVHRQADDPAPVASAALKVPAGDASTVQLVEAAFKEARELVKIEFALAKLEATNQLKSARNAVIGFVTAGLFVVVSLTLLAIAAVLAAGGTAVTALIAASATLAIAGAAGALGYKLLPLHPLERTRRHLEDDFKQVKEHVA